MRRSKLLSGIVRCGYVLGVASVALGDPRPASSSDPEASHTFVSVGRDESLSVESAGTGKPVVLLPGLFGAAFGFRRIVPLLVDAGYRAVVIEPLGIGQSSRPPEADYSLAAQADRVASVIDSLGLADVIVIAHSMGAAEALRLAYRHPRALGGLILIEGGPTEQASTPAFRRALRFVGWFHMFGGLSLIRHEIRRSLVHSSGDAGWVTDSVVAGYTEPAAANLKTMLKAYLCMATAKEPEALAPHLTEIHAPVRLMVGTAAHEGDVTEDEVDLLKHTLTLFAVDSVAGAGHFIQEERPEQIMVSLARLEQTRRATPSGAGHPPSRSH